MTDDVLDQAIFSTLSYASVFHAGVSLDEFHARLICSASISKRALVMRLEHFLSTGVLVEREGWITLKEHASELSGSITRSQESERKVQKLTDNAWWFRMIPTIKGVGITGSVAAQNAKKNDDIDVMVICAAGTLWMTRAIVQTIAFFQGKLRRSWMKHVADRWCFNLWLDETSLPIPTHSLYVAREVIQVHWILNRDQIRERFVAANGWVRAWYATTKIPSVERGAQSFWWWTRPLEYLVYHMQLSYMHGKRSREVVTPSSAFFHPRDTNREVMRKYEALCSHIRHTSSRLSTTHSQRPKK